MADFVNIKRMPPPGSPLYDPPPEDECYDHCICLNDEDLTKLGATLPERGDILDVRVMGRVVGVGDDHGHRYARVEIEHVMMVENETTEGQE